MAWQMTNPGQYKDDWTRLCNGERLYICPQCNEQTLLKDETYSHCIQCGAVIQEGGNRVSRLIGKQDTPAITALEYEEMRDWEKHPEKTGYYAELIEKRTAAENPRRKPNKKKRREKK